MTPSEDRHVFIWKDFKEWKSALEDMFKDILTPELKANVKQNREIVEYCDDPEAFGTLSSQSISDMITTKKINEFRLRYSHIRVYHGCRPVDVQSYYKKGLLLCDTDALVERFREIFLSGKFPELTEEILQESIEEAASYSIGRDGESCFFLDDRVCVERDSHYLIYGSEYLSVLVANLPVENSKEKYYPVLRGIGKPTIFEIDLPNIIENVRDNVMFELFQDMLTEWTSCVAHSRTEISNSEICISLRKAIQPEHIHSHYHPPKIKDRLNEGKIYDTETGEYKQDRGK
jgi:hypothetical protein